MQSNVAVGDGGFYKIQWLLSQTETLRLTSVNSLPSKLIFSCFFQIYHSRTKLSNKRTTAAKKCTTTATIEREKGKKKKQKWLGLKESANPSTLPCHHKIFEPTWHRSFPGFTRSVRSLSKIFPPFLNFFVGFSCETTLFPCLLVLVACLGVLVLGLQFNPLFYLSLNVIVSEQRLRLALSRMNYFEF